MMPLACILHAKGHAVCGSDRSRDQGKSSDKFKALEKLGLKLFSQDGSGVTKDIDVFVTSTAVESTIPDVGAALARNIKVQSRAECLAELFHESEMPIGIAGTSGKTTVTGMVATVFEELGLSPTVMNGGQVKNLQSDMSAVGGNFLIGKGGAFISEMDESDGSIDLFTPAIALINNITFDHKPLDVLQEHFQGFVNRATQAAIINLDDANAAKLDFPKNTLTYSITNQTADLTAENIDYTEGGVSFTVAGCSVSLNVPGAHNVSNALAVLCVAKAVGLDFEKACHALSKFEGIKRRMETIGVKDGITVIDDFGHNPDKIAAGLKTAKQNGARLIVMFQAHGFAPLRLMGDEIVESFKDHFNDNDMLLMPEVYYAGGTVDRSVTAKDIIERAKSQGINAHWFEKRSDIKGFIQDKAREGDKVLIMGARDDTLSEFAHDVLKAL